jgi:alginate O-acetyltransferase complex protein AlgI
MSFLSREFAVLFAILVASLLIVRPHSARKVLILLVSAVFYGWADWRFLFVLATVTVADYSIAQRLFAEQRPPLRRALVTLSLALNLGFLFAFKYSYFAAVNAAHLLGRTAPSWKLALPIGISFYTFETLSYVFDVYRGNTTPAASLLDYAVFVTFFPRLVAGPIMRAPQFLQQLSTGLRLTPQSFASGAQLFSLGLLKKVVLADNLAFFVDHVYRDPSRFTPSSVWAAAISYSIQIYCDFSAYTDMATGLSRILGIELPVNFRRPYAAQSITEFWQRWHISLSSWLRDYLYIPLGGSRNGTWKTYRNLVITMLLGGLWHGAQWTFVIWGLTHAALLIVERLLARGRKIKPAPWSHPVAWLRNAACFITLTLTWVLFRSPTIDLARDIYRKLLFLDTDGIVWIYWSVPAVLVIVWLADILSSRIPARRLELRWSSPLLPAFFLFAALTALLFMPEVISPFIYFRF